jgi:hypothetical protein
VREERTDPTSSDVRDPLLKQLLAYWQEKRGTRAMPSRGDLDPLEMKFALGSVMLVDVLRDPLRYRIRLHGSELSRRGGFDLTGKMLDEMPLPEAREFARLSFTRVVDAQLPIWGIRERMADGKILRYEALLLPLSAKGDGVDMLLIGMRYID